MTSGEHPPPWRRWLASLRVRIVGWYLLLFSVALLLSIMMVRAVLLGGVEERIDRGLSQRASELRALAGERDPETGEPFAGDVERLFEVYLRRTVPEPGEMLIAYRDGEPWRRSVGEPPLRLDRVPGLTERWGALTAFDRGRVELDEVGAVDYLGMPVHVGDAVAGVLVAARFRALERAEVDAAVRVAWAVGLAALAAAAAVTWSVSRRVLEPVHAVTQAARRITETDLGERIDVTGADEVATLARTFNGMLDRLEGAFASQRAFLDDVGHELRTPITIVRGHLELLEDGDAADRAATVALVVDELDRMHRMVEDLLLLARAEQPDFLQPRVLEAHALLEEVAGKVRGLAPRDWRVAELGEGTFVGDRQRLTQALVELAGNAVRHTAEGDVIALGSAASDGEVRLWVRDTGEGIAPEDQERVLERFARGRAAGGHGCGLGLAIVRAVAEAHGGRVELASQPGRGTTVTLVLPAARAPATAPAEA